MTEIESMVALLAGAVGLGVVARGLGLAYPILLLVGGLLLGLQSWTPDYALPPDVVFGVFLPPLLFAAGVDTHWPSFRRQLRAISLLAVGLVLFTTAAVAWAAHDLVGLSWSSAFVLGAIVSPPDAVAAAAVTRQVRVPAVVNTLIEGESLVNDASALVAYRVAIGVVAGHAFDLLSAGVEFVAVSAGGVLIGVAGAWLTTWVHRWLDRSGLGDAKRTVAVTLLTPYAVYFPAEHLGVSGVLAAVAAGLWVSRRKDGILREEVRVEVEVVWETVEFLLNSVIFILIGFQLPLILTALGDRHPPADLARWAAAVAGVVVVARLVWMFPGAYLPRWVDRRVFGAGDPYPPWQSVVVVGWAGMRGVISLAIALALPKEFDGTPYRDRELIQFLTFWVIFATLVGQGLTLPLLIRWLGVSARADGEPGALPPRC